MAEKRESVTYFSLREEVLKGTFRSIYVLQGEEPYYIDQLCDLITERALDEASRAFNQSIYYGNEADVRQVIATCKEYPAFAERRLVVLREAQLVPKQAGGHKKDLELFKSYAENPSPTTVLVICHKGGSMSARPFTDQLKASRSGVVMTSARVREGRDLLQAITSYTTSIGCKIDGKSATMLADFIGTDLSRMFGEIDKLKILTADGQEGITPELIEKNIGISKDFNNFELEEALARRDAVKAYRIIDYFEKNPKNNPTVVTVSMMFSFFSSVLIVRTMQGKSQDEQMAAVRTTSPWRLRKFQDAARQYSTRACVDIIAALRQCDTMSKGIGSRQDQYALLRELVFKILHAPTQ